METIYAWANALWPLWLMLLFLCIVAWAFWPKRKARFEKARADPAARRRQAGPLSHADQGREGRHHRQETTGHEWDGIKELNTPLPKWWLYVLYATIAWSVVYWLLLSELALGHRLLRRPARRQPAARARGAHGDGAREPGRASRSDRRAPTSARSASDPELLSFALAGGQAAFADNCAPCHGLGGAGQGTFPTLADDVWIWGGTLDDIHTTILHGVRSDSDQTRFNEMPAFGATSWRATRSATSPSTCWRSPAEARIPRRAAARARRSTPSSAPPATARQARACRSSAGRG